MAYYLFLLSSASLRHAYIRRASRPLAWTRFKGYFDIDSKSENFKQRLEISSVIDDIVDLDVLST